MAQLVVWQNGTDATEIGSNSVGQRGRVASDERVAELHMAQFSVNSITTGSFSDDRPLSTAS
jgi:hypothetical protein